MPTVEQRYQAATAYVHTAIAAVEDRGVVYAIDPVTGFVEWYAGRVKTQQPRTDLVRIEARWLRATRDDERAQLARDAELLADRVQENLPGAPQDRARTNLYAGETPTSTPATSYYGEAASQSRDAWDWLKQHAGTATDGASTVGKLLLAGGGIVLGWRVFDYLRDREHNRVRGATDQTQHALNRALAGVAEQRDARTGRPPRAYSLRLTRGEIEALDFLRGRYSSAKVFHDALIPLDDDADHALAREFVREQGPYRFQIRANDVRKTLRATVTDGGDYGAIPNLRSDAVDWVLGEESRHAP